MEDEYELLRDAAALIEEFEPFSIDLHDVAHSSNGSPAPSSTDVGYNVIIPFVPASTSAAYASSSDGEGDRSSPNHRRVKRLNSTDFVTTPTTANAQDSSSSSDAFDNKQQTGKNPSRERLKAELAFLRDKVVELEKELSDLRYNHEQVATANAKTTAIAPVWRRIAERQLERRRTAETENERLKTTLDGQIRVAKSLEHMLRKRSSAAMIDLYEGARGSKKRSRTDENIESLYVQFMGDIEEAYQSVDRVFDSNGLANTFDETVRGYSVKTRNWGGMEQIYIELMDVKIVPFNFERASEAVWRMTMQEFHGQRCTIETFQSMGDRFAVKFQAKSRSHEYEGLLDVTMVMRRFLEKDRMVIAWRATNSPSLETKYKEWRNVYTEETGWIVVKRVPDDCSGIGATTAVMQSCVHLIPRWYGNESPPRGVPVKINTGDFAKLVMNSYEDAVIAITEAVENMLLDEAVSGRVPEPSSIHTAKLTN